MPLRIKDIRGHRGFFRKGDLITAIDGRKVEDQLDIYFILSEADSAVFSIERADGRKSERRIRVETLQKAEPVFEEMRFIHCASRCIFCFVDQMPPGMRDTLYFKDDDYRLSFLFGNYVTLNDMTKAQVDRVIEYNLTPLYVSVHATDRKVREKIFGRPMRREIMPLLSRLADGGITLHAQVVAIPGINDGPVLEATARDLSTLYPACRTLAVVPVGLTGYRQGLEKLEGVTAMQARKMIDLAGRINRTLRDVTGGHDFVYMSDEFYLLAGRAFPDAESYGAFEQLSNGVGMSRMFIERIRERVASLAGRRKLPEGRMTLVTGKLGGKLLKGHILPVVRKALPGLKISLLTVRNSTFGSSVTVSGLLSGRDIAAAVKRKGLSEGLLVLPPNSVNHQGLMLDDMSPASLEKETGMKVMVPDEDFLEEGVLRAAGRSIR